MFGGIDFAQDIDYNDLYIFNTDTLEWKYVGETGVDVKGRNSHCLGIIQSNQSSYLVVYGGASSQDGIMNDTIFATLPPPESINLESIFVEWKKLHLDNHPGKREMFSKCCYKNDLYIIGGRNMQGLILNDVWKLCCDSDSLTWVLLSNLKLPIGQCAHGCAIIDVDLNSTKLCIFGGFTDDGQISHELIHIDINSCTVATWDKANLMSDISPRFGLCMTSISSKLDFSQSSPVNRNLSNVGFAIFAGISAEKDFSELYLLSC